MNLDHLADALRQPRHDPVPLPSHRHPTGWEPGVDTATGRIVTEPSDQPDPPTDWSDVLRMYHLDPDRWEVVNDEAQFRTWDAAIGHGQVRRMFYWRATVRPRRRGADVDQILEKLATWRPRLYDAKQVRDGAFFELAGDLQLGKPDGGGSAATLARFLKSTERAAHKLKLSLPRGHKQALTVLPWLGDCIEGIWSQGGSNNLRLDLTPTGQVRAYRRMIRAQLAAFLPLSERILVPVVPGNHDETIRVAGKRATAMDDSWAVEGALSVADAIAENDSLTDRVRFLFPLEDSGEITLDAAGTKVGMVHGHQMPGGTDGWRKWWNDQAGGRRPIGSTDLLLAAHLHHLRVEEHGDGRLFIQTPALDGGSNWYRDRHGDDSPGRTVSFWTAGGEVWGLDPMTV